MSYSQKSRAGIFHKLPADNRFEFAVWKLWVRIYVPFVLENTRRVPGENAACRVESSGRTDEVDGSARTCVNGCFGVEPNGQLFGICNGLLYYFGAMGKAALVLKGCIASFDCHCSILVTVVCVICFWIHFFSILFLFWIDTSPVR